MNAIVHQADDGLVYITNSAYVDNPLYQFIQNDFEENLHRLCPQIKRIHYVSGNKAEKDFVCYKVHSSLLGNTETGITVEYKAGDLFGSYIYALTLTDIPVADTAENYVFTVTPYVIPTGETTPVSGAAYTVTYSANGSFVSCVAAPLA